MTFHSLSGGFIAHDSQRPWKWNHISAGAIKTLSGLPVLAAKPTWRKGRRSSQFDPSEHRRPCQLLGGCTLRYGDERLRKVGEDVIDMLDSDCEAHIVVANSGAEAILRR